MFLSCHVRIREMTRTYCQMHHTDKYSQHSSIIWPVWLNVWMFVYELSGRGFDPSCNHLNSDFMPASSKEFLDIHATIECGFTLKRILDMTRTYSQMHRTGNYSQHSSIIWPVWLDGWTFVYELSGCGFKSSCSRLPFLYWWKAFWIILHQDWLCYIFSKMLQYFVVHIIVIYRNEFEISLCYIILQNAFLLPG